MALLFAVTSNADNRMQYLMCFAILSLLATVAAPSSRAERATGSERCKGQAGCSGGTASDSVLIAGFVPQQGFASAADGEAFSRHIVGLLNASGFPAVYGGMEPCIRARQFAALRRMSSVVCGRLLRSGGRDWEIEYMVVERDTEFGPSYARAADWEDLARQVHQRALTVLKVPGP